MPLSPCRDCGHNVNSRAESCLKCGRISAFESLRLVARFMLSVIVFLVLVYP